MLSTTPVKPISNFDAEAPHASSLSQNCCCSGFAVATPVGVQKVVPSSQLIRFGGLPCESRGSQVVPPDAVQTGAIVTPNAVRKHRMPLRTRGGSDASTQSSRQQSSSSAFTSLHLGCSEVPVANTFGCAGGHPFNATALPILLSAAIAPQC